MIKLKKNFSAVLVVWASNLTRKRSIIVHMYLFISFPPNQFPNTIFIIRRYRVHYLCNAKDKFANMYIIRKGGNVLKKNPHLIGTNQKTNDECPPYFQSPPSPFDYRQRCIQEKDTLFLMPKTPKVFKGQYEDKNEENQSRP